MAVEAAAKRDGAKEGGGAAQSEQQQGQEAQEQQQQPGQQQEQQPGEQAATGQGGLEEAGPLRAIFLHADVVRVGVCPFGRCCGLGCVGGGPSSFQRVALAATDGWPHVPWSITPWVQTVRRRVMGTWHMERRRHGPRCPMAPHQMIEGWGRQLALCCSRTASGGQASTHTTREASASPVPLHTEAGLEGES